MKLTGNDAQILLVCWGKGLLLKGTDPLIEKIPDVCELVYAAS